MSNSKLLLITVFCSLAMGTTLISNTHTVADDADRIYGKGVHAFFDRDYEAAITILSQAETIKSADPRPYYFLGLAYLRQNNTEQADRYFEKAAQLEYSGRTARDFGVAEALRRIQGEERRRIETIRLEERTNAQIREQQHREARYSNENAAGRDALRQLGQQNQREDLAVLQRMAGNLGENAFRVRPIDPIATPEEIATARRVETNPFGSVTVTVTEAPAIPAAAPAPPVVRPPASTGTGRVFVNPDAPIVERDSKQPNATGPGAFTQGAREAARGMGNFFGELFSRKTNGE